jgi:hypothetical protein
VTSTGDVVQQVVGDLSATERKLFQTRLDRVLRRREAIARFPMPGHLAQFLRRDSVQTPLLDKLDEVITQAWHGVQRRWIISTPPQEGKTTRISQDGSLWLLLRDPSLRIAVASYEQGIASQPTLAVRQFIELHGAGYKGERKDLDRVDVLGLTLDPDRAQQTNWALTDIPGRKGAGGMLAVGVGSAFTGRPVDVLIVDDPLKDAKQADSPVYRQAAKDWFQAVASARLSGRAIVIVIQTRWHEDDLSGWLIKEDDARVTPIYARLNIPAQAGQNDPLGREPGEWLVSARGRTREEWEAKPDQIGVRWWNALYQGVPSAPEGGSFKRQWFERNRVSAAPEMASVLTMVDPADNTGAGDEAGIITGGIGADGDYYVLADDSGHYTVGEWIRRAIFAMAKWGGSALAYEKSLSGLRRSIRTEWKLIRRQARILDECYRSITRQPWPVAPDKMAAEHALAQLVVPEDSLQDRWAIDDQLRMMWPNVPILLSWPAAGPPTRQVNPIVNKRLRAEFIAPMYSSGAVHHVGHFMELEHQMATWLPSQDSPDRMDADVHLITELSRAGTGSLQAPKATRERQIQTKVSSTVHGMNIRTRP